jgi:hypothetical protein
MIQGAKFKYFDQTFHLYQSLNEDPLNFLHIDFDKLSFQKPGLTIYFFIQYQVGLGCLFFILNAILKI